MTPGTRPFGTTAHGQDVLAVTIANGDLSATILTYGATLQDVRLAGTPWPLTLGADSVSAYETRFRYFGAIVGPVANRIAGAAA
ncbi:MAG: aldose 1-epimerase, partial [Pseudomonadota bacterium]